MEVNNKEMMNQDKLSDYCMKEQDEDGRPVGLAALVDKIDSEPQEGNIEYKLMLLDPTEERLNHLVTQMQWRLNEGNGEAFYAIGVEDDGTCTGLSDDQLMASLETVKRMSEACNCDMSLLQRRKAKRGWVAEVLVRRRAEEGDFIDMRVAVVGNVDSGKSTLVGVLASGKLDNGRGLARSQVFRHRHEAETGRTSSVSHHVIGFNAQGSLINHTSLHPKSSPEIVRESSKVVTFVDLAGHEKYIKTTVYGMTGSVPDYTMVVVGANMGVQRMTREHLGVALALKCATFFVVTKIDMCPQHVLQNTLNELIRIIKSPGIRRIPLLVQNEADVVSAAKAMGNGARIAPIFKVSNTTGENLPLLHLWLNLVPAQKDEDCQKSNEPAQFHIDDTFTVTGVGAVVGGTLMRGRVSLKTNLVLGPDSHGAFVPVQLKSIMNKSLPVTGARAGQSVTLALKKVKRGQIRKGMVLIDAALAPKASVRFVAEIVVLHHATTISPGYQPVVHTLTVRQACRVVSMVKESMRTGDRATVTFEFLFRPEFLTLGANLLFREGRTKGIGRIISLVHIDGSITSIDANSELDPAAPTAMAQ
mmetsp:Transcript_28154/g.57670  ORF Transcript_28154/g.57670 Transcript_28154/m.57670 type:complete len:588 (+) Transcript_28154:145-1908(+)